MKKFEGSETMNRIKYYPAIVAGWGFPLNSKKSHYFVNGRSLCGKWLFFGHVDPANDDRYEKCSICLKRLRKKEAKNG